MPRYADVALPIAVDKEFTYSIPPDLASAAQVGVRALVPFGRTHATGLIVGLSDEAAVKGIRSLRDILDPRPIVLPDMLQLCRWVADYYMAPLGEVLKAAVPHGFASTTTRVVSPGPLFNQEPSGERPRRSRLRDAVLDVLRASGGISTGALQKRTGISSINALLGQLESEGLVEIEEIIRTPGGGTRVEQVIALEKVNGERLRGALQSTPARKKATRRLLAAALVALDAGEGMVLARDLIRRAQTTSATLREVVREGTLPLTRREVTTQETYGTEDETRRIQLNDAQQKALGRIARALDLGTHTTFLLHGVTGSGKTQVYIEAIKQCLGRGRSAIVLVPEISLTPQIVRRFRSHFADRVMVVHSRMAAGERLLVWRRALEGVCSVVIGPRSAVFAPLRDVGLIVVDEEHEASYKQYDAQPRYHARDIAIVRGSLAGASVVLGSATPSMESFANAEAGKYELLEMPDRIDRVRMPEIHIVDMAAERKRRFALLRAVLPPEQRSSLRKFRHPALSSLLRERIADRLEKAEGIILLQNRRGFAPFVECPDCGHVEMCDNCQVTLTYHITKKHLRCHYCGLVRTPPDECPACRGVDLRMQGIGTQRVEEELHEVFPAARVLRMDLDTTRSRGAHERFLRMFGDRKADILLGTQMVAKGLDFPHVTLVGVVSADTQMLLPDFRSAERTFQLLTQVAGRAGRSTILGEVIIQTHQSSHAALRHVQAHDYRGFYDEETAQRRELGYPPYARLVLLEYSGENEERVREAAEHLSSLLRRSNGAFTILGPAPAVLPRLRKQWRWHTIIKNPKASDPSGAHLREVLHGVLRAVQASRTVGVRLTVDVDPVGLL